MIAASRVLGSNFAPHISENEYYLHYFAINVPSWGIISSLKHESPASILTAAKNKISIARAKQQQQIQQMAASGNLDLKEAANIESLLIKTSWLENFEPTTEVEGALTFPDIDLSKADSAVQDAIDTLSANGTALDAIQKSLNENIPNLTQADMKVYALLLEDYFVNKSYKEKVPLTGLRAEVNTSWQSAALEAILSRENLAFFQRSTAKYKGKFAEWSADQTKLLTSLMLLQDPHLPAYVQTIAKKGITIRHGTGEESYTKEATEILQAFFDKIRNYFNQVNAIGLEAAVGQGIIKAQKEAGIEFEEMHKSIGNFSGTGNVSVTTDFSETQAFFDEVNKKAFGFAHRRAKKSDTAAIDISEDGVRVVQGITVKKGRDLSFNPDNPQAITLQIQRSTPLLTLLAREAGLGKDQLLATVQLLAAHGSDTGYETALVNQWNDLMKTVKYKAFLDTLAGFTNEIDSAFYMVINNRIYDIITIIDSLNISENYINWTLDSKTIDGSLEYADYNILNPWRGKEDPDYIDAESRSDLAFKEINTKLYNTKIRVTLHIAELAALTSINK